MTAVSRFSMVYSVFCYHFPRAFLPFCRNDFIHFPLYGLVALGIVGGQHFGQFDDPMALELLIDLAAFKILQVIREPVIIDAQKPEKRRFPGSLIPDYTDDIVELCTRFKHP